MINQLTAKPMVILNRSLRPQTDLISAKSGYVLKNVPAEVCVTSLQGCIFQVCLLGLFFFLEAASLISRRHMRIAGESCPLPSGSLAQHGSVTPLRNCPP